MTIHDTYPGSGQWHPAVAFDAFPFVRVAKSEAVAGSHVAMVDLGMVHATTSAVDAILHPEERVLVNALPAPRQSLFISGRIALRAAIGGVRQEAMSAALLRNTRGAPTLPTGLAGSISHKRTIAVAMAAPTGQDPSVRITLGIDVEERAHTRHRLRDIAPRILTPSEMRMLPEAQFADREEAVLLLFAMKEAIYKAIDPFVERHVRFKEVEITANEPLTGESGSASVVTHLPEFATRAPTVAVHWWKDDRHLFAVANTNGMR